MVKQLRQLSMKAEHALKAVDFARWWDDVGLPYVL